MFLWATSLLVQFHLRDQTPKVPPPAKRQKRNLADEMICPIRLELPFDPVTAEDGRVYEKEAVLEYFNSREGEQENSPFTNKPMGTKLLPATQHRNTIEILIEMGAICGDLAKKWKQKAKKKKALEDTKKKADGGDRDAAEKLLLSTTLAPLLASNMT